VIGAADRDALHVELWRRAPPARRSTLEPVIQALLVLPLAYRAVSAMIEVDNLGKVGQYRNAGL
jgi:hypothetical protein